MKGLTTINIGGKERPIKFGLQQSITYCEMRGITISEMQDELSKLVSGDGTGAEIRDLLYSALKDGARVKKLNDEFEAADVADWIEEIDPDELKKAFSVMGESMPDEDLSLGKQGKKKVETK